MARQVLMTYEDIERAERWLLRMGGMLEIAKGQMIDQQSRKKDKDLIIEEFVSSNALTGVKGMKYIDNWFGDLVSDVQLATINGVDKEKVDLTIDECCDHVSYRRL